MSAPAPAIRTNADPLARPARARPSRSQRFGGSRLLALTLYYGLLTAIAAVFLVPYVFTFFASFKSLGQIYNEPAWALPHSLSLKNYRYDLFDADFGRYLGNTAFVTIILTTGQVFFSVLAAYAFARLKFPGRDKIFWFYLITLMVPSIVTIIPLYTIMRLSHLLNTYWVIFLPYVFGTPYTIFLIRQFFRNIPQEIIDAARMDGCSEIGVLRRVVVPLSKPVIVTTALIAFVFGWNNFLWPLIAINSGSRYVLTTGLSYFQSYTEVQWNQLLAGSVITLLPLIVIFAVFQKQILRSIQMTQIR
jgi:multiple sugar transport system permease protein